MVNLVLYLHSLYFTEKEIHLVRSVLKQISTNRRLEDNTWGQFTFQENQNCSLLLNWMQVRLRTGWGGHRLGSKLLARHEPGRQNWWDGLNGAPTPLSPVWPTKPTLTWRSFTLAGDFSSLFLSKSSSIQEFPHSSTHLLSNLSITKCPFTLPLAHVPWFTHTLHRYIQLTFIKRLAGPGLAGLNPGGSSSYPGLVELKSEREHLGKLSNEVGSKRDL